MYTDFDPSAPKFSHLFFHKRNPSALILMEEEEGCICIY